MALARSRPYLSTIVSFFGPVSPSGWRTSALKPSLLRISATAALSLLAGTSVRSWRARAALRMRDRRSAMGSVIMASPAGLDHTGELTAQREHPQADAAELEVAVVGAGPAAYLAAVAAPDGERRGPVHLRILFCTSHSRGP